MVGSLLQALARLADDPRWEEGGILSKEGEEQLVEEVGDTLGFMPGIAELLGQIREGAGGLLGKLATSLAWPQYLGIVKECMEDAQWLSRPVPQVDQSERVFTPDRIREVGADDEAIEVGDHEERRVLQRFPIVEELLVGPLEVLVMPLVLPAKVSAKPDVGPPIAPARLGRTLLEGIRFAPTIGVGGGYTEHRADVDKVLLCGCTLSVGVAEPLGGELGGVHDCL